MMPRDLILQLTDVVSSYATCEDVFKTRGTHRWPPQLDLPEHWIDPVNRLIRELELPIADAHAGIARIGEFMDRILSSAKEGAWFCNMLAENVRKT